MQTFSSCLYLTNMILQNVHSPRKKLININIKGHGCYLNGLQLCLCGCKLAVFRAHGGFQRRHTHVCRLQQIYAAAGRGAGRRPRQLRGSCRLQWRLQVKPGGASRLVICRCTKLFLHADCMSVRSHQRYRAARAQAADTLSDDKRFHST